MRMRRLTQRSIDAYEARGAEKAASVLRQQLKNQARLTKLQNALTAKAIRKTVSER